ncbi:MAG: hypothetical protein NUV97_00360 [archaeon]|nr:hypothetical protein [archaeon]MCR4324003.1 hypothetical protein [Nanoarchaeota archaeon]
MVVAKENLAGAYAFLMGVVLAVAMGIFNNSLEGASGIFYSLLVLIGLVVGYVSVSDKNSINFLLASLSLVIVAGMGIQPLLYVAKQNVVVDTLRNVLGTLMVLFVPATIVVALKTVFAMAKV